MAFSSILFRSASSVTPIAARLLVAGQRNFSHQCSGVLISHARKIVLKSSLLVDKSRRYSSSSSLAVKLPSSDDSLLRILDAEIKCSEESFEEDEDIPEGFPFQLSDNLGLQTVSLTREYKGETILVEVEPSSLITDDASDSDAEKDDPSSLPMVVKISKPDGPSLEFGVTSYNDKIVIESLSVKDPSLPADKTPFEGPRFDELEEGMQQAFHGFLERRGIKAGATKFLHEYTVNKEHREYTHWLKQLKKFVEA